MAHCKRYHRFAGNVRSSLGALIPFIPGIQRLASDTGAHAGIIAALDGVTQDLRQLQEQAWQVDGFQPRNDDGTLTPTEACPTCKGSGRIAPGMHPRHACTVTAVREAFEFVTTHGVTGGVHALAGVLLHCYDPHCYRLDITDLCVMDPERQALAWAVLELRVSGHEPQEALADPEQFTWLVMHYGRAFWAGPEPFEQPQIASEQ